MADGLDNDERLRLGKSALLRQFEDALDLGDRGEACGDGGDSVHANPGAGRGLEAREPPRMLCQFAGANSKIRFNASASFSSLSFTGSE
jgi:hypothetical protein